MDATLAGAAWLYVRGALFVFRHPNPLDIIDGSNCGVTGVGIKGLGFRALEEERNARDFRTLRLHAQPALPRQLFYWAGVYHCSWQRFAWCCVHPDDFGHLSAGNARRIRDPLPLVRQKVCPVRKGGPAFLAPTFPLSRV